MQLKFFILLLSIISFYKTEAAKQCLTLKSPSGKIQLSLYHEGIDSFYYSIQAKKQIVIKKSLLGLIINRRSFFNGSENPRLVSISSKKAFNDFIVDFGRAKMEFYLSEEGCAFRYIMPQGKKEINAEQTTFTLDSSYNAWYFERNNAWKLQSYAGLWSETRVDSLGVISATGPIQGKPIVVELPKLKYLFITEAALFNYSGMRFYCTGNKFQVNFTEDKKGFYTTADCTPWRVIGFASDLNALVNTSLIKNLNPLPDSTLYKDRSYIKEGRSVWSWITKNENYLQPTYEKKFIDAASQLKFEYTLIDDGWETRWKNKWDTLQELVHYAAGKKIGVWVWKDSHQLKDTIYRDLFLDSLKKYGVVGIKVDFMNSEALELINFETDLLIAAAKRKLMVDLHGCHTSTGEYITYLNEMTREGIRGMELNTINEPIPAWHNAALPFTRFITGPADYTPGLFSNKGSTTYTHQLALLYLFNSPFQCLAENPLILLREPRYKPIIPLITTLPVSWDETVVLPVSKIGKLAVIAKRKDSEWYIAAINGENNTISFTIDYSLLAKNKKFSAEIISDKKDATGFDIINTQIKYNVPQVIKLLPSGGIVIHLKPI